MAIVLNGQTNDVTVDGDSVVTEEEMLEALNAKQDSATAINATNITQQSVANATKWNGATMYTSTSEFSGGANGDIWLQYEV